MQIKDVIAVVTGGASGLGEACVRSLVEKGGKAAILDFAKERAEQIISELGDSVIFCNTDVTDAKTVQAAVDRTVEVFGSLNVAINCAGVSNAGKVLSKKGPLPIEQFNRVVQINLIGTMNVVTLAADKMVKNDPFEDGEKGVIINTASAAAFEGQVGQAAYSASKAGVVGMALPIAREFADYGIRIMTIAPGLFMTPMLAGLPEHIQESLNKMVPFPKRLGKASEYADLVQHIIENTMLNAEVIRLDGAIRMAAK